MLKILQGGFSSNASLIIKNELHTLVENKKSAFLIVPEQKTVISEKEMASFLPPSAPLYFEVTNFTRFSNTVFRSLGGIAGEYADASTRSLIMWRTLSELSHELSMTGGAKEINTGMVEKALSAIKEMQSLSIDSSKLFVASREESIKENTRLVTKLSDLSKIMARYKALLSEKFLDSEDDLATLSKKVKENPEFFRDKSFFVEGFTSFTSAQRLLISALSSVADLTVSFSIPKEYEDAFEFTELRLSINSLKRDARSLGAEIKLLYANGTDESKNPLLTELTSLLWKSKGKLNSPEKAESVIRMFSADDPYEECDFIMSDIKRRVMAGESYSDFAIITRNVEDYAGIIDTAFTRAKIPSFISKRRDLSTFEAIKLIFTALAIIDSDFSRGNVISYAKCGLSGISRDACDEFELYTERWQINGRRFYDGLLWNMNPEGYTERKSPDYTEKLERINLTKEKIINPIISLKDELSTEKDVTGYAKALFKFLTAIELEKRIDERTNELYALGENMLAEENSHIWKIICSSLDKLVNTLGESPIDRRGFISQLKAVISSADIGRIPAYTDAVTIASADMVRLYSKKHIYLIAVNLGEFPYAPKENSYFTDRDKLILTGLGLPLEDERSEVRCARELYAFSRALSIASDTVTLSYSERKKDFSVSRPSEVIPRIEEICDGKVKVKKISKLPPCERIYTFDSAIEKIDSLSEEEKDGVTKALTSLGYGDALSLCDQKIKNDTHTLSSETLPLLYKEDISLTQTRLEDFVNCPFSHFLRYTLRLSDNEEASFNARNIGNFIHSVLENFFATVDKNGGDINALSEDEKQNLIRTTAVNYVNSVCEDATSRTNRMNVLVDRICRATSPIIEDMCDEMRGCKFKPKFFELPITSEDDVFPSPSVFKSKEDRRVFVYGKIDRVDTYEEGGDVYVRVIDYKTGSKEFSPDDIEKGKNLQMFLYLKSIVESKNPHFLKSIGVEEGKRLIPAGVIYLKLDLAKVNVEKDVSDDEVLKIAKEKQSRRGMILDDPINHDATNKSLGPIKWNKDGTPSKNSKNYLYTPDRWKEINNTIGNVIGNVSSKMESGYIKAEPNPDSDPCSYCRYKVICRSGKTKVK